MSFLDRANNYVTFCETLGWPSFRDEEVVWDNVRTLENGVRDTRPCKSFFVVDHTLLLLLTITLAPLVTPVL